VISNNQVSTVWFTPPSDSWVAQHRTATKSCGIFYTVPYQSVHPCTETERQASELSAQSSWAVWTHTGGVILEWGERQTLSWYCSVVVEMPDPVTALHVTCLFSQSLPTCVLTMTVLARQTLVSLGALQGQDSSVQAWSGCATLLNWKSVLIKSWSVFYFPHIALKVYFWLQLGDSEKANVFFHSLIMFWVNQWGKKYHWWNQFTTSLLILKKSLFHKILLL
jgi:hypothetical protein